MADACRTGRWTDRARAGLPSSGARFRSPKTRQCSPVASVRLRPPPTRTDTPSFREGLGRFSLNGLEIKRVSRTFAFNRLGVDQVLKVAEVVGHFCFPFWSSFRRAQTLVSER